ncbi:MAG: hypothetical protein FJ096_08880 [Deltaproteobacteria bacterium]|nr:hypothetical protein [Deltaproteobacteria bacterium]
MRSVRFAQGPLLLGSLLLGSLLGSCGGTSSDVPAGGGGAGGGATVSSSGSGETATTAGSSSALESLLAALDVDRDAALLAQSRDEGWPAPVEGGYLFVTTDLTQASLAGAFNGWTPVPMTARDDFAWLVVAAAPGDGYKFTDGGTEFVADAWSRGYGHDDHGVMSFVKPSTGPHLERHFEVGGNGLAARTLRVLVPAAQAQRILYVHDGQNLFDPDAIAGGWRLQETVPADTMVVGVDNTPARMDEYTHVPDDLGSGPIGGKADDYADFLHGPVRALIQATYGEPAVVGVMGSSLGGLASLHVADRHPGEYRFAASLSGTLGWGSIGPAIHQATMVERLVAHGHRDTVLYLDSGGGGPCADTDSDGIEDDGDGSDNYCETKQLEQALLGVGYTSGVDLHHWHEPGAPHNEAAWAARVFRPFAVFAKLP